MVTGIQSDDEGGWGNRIMFWRKTKVRQKVRTTLYDLTHLEINTIIKDEMDASKAPDSVRLLLHSIATKYHTKLEALGELYCTEIQGTAKIPATIDGERDQNYFRDPVVYDGSSYLSFRELRVRARDAIEKVKENRNLIVNLTEDKVNADLKMLGRIATISQDLRNILQTKERMRLNRKDEKDVTTVPGGELDFDKASQVLEFRTMKEREARKFEPDLDLRQLMVIQKANDMGTESVVMQTIIGMDGDVTTRISQAFANNPLPFITDIHHNAITTSVEFWKTLVNIVVEFGKQLIKLFKGN
jgi:hypothetical protein